MGWLAIGLIAGTFFGVLVGVLVIVLVQGAQRVERDQDSSRSP